MFNTDPDHHEHHEHHNEDIQHLWDEWSEHGAYHDQNIAVNSERSDDGCDKASGRFAALSVHIVSEAPPPHTIRWHWISRLPVRLSGQERGRD